MSSNSFGNLFRITTWGESHGLAIGVVIDGCPAGLPLKEADINAALARRAPGKSPYTSPRNEPDEAKILSGVFEGVTTGAPILILIPNQDVDSSKYMSIKHLLRPGHANSTYLEKYGVFDYRGGGRSSARETACRVAAGAVAQQLLAHYAIEVGACVAQVGTVKMTVTPTLLELKQTSEKNPFLCPDPIVAEAMKQELMQAQKEGDSLGGVVLFLATGLPIGLGDPIYEKLEANLAKAMLSLPASKGFEIGEGFGASAMRGSVHNDPITPNENVANHAGGVLGGITTGSLLIGRVAFKPPSSIRKEQRTVDVDGKEAIFVIPPGSRHDPCVVLRAVPVVEAMTALVLADALLMNRSARLW